MDNKQQLNIWIDKELHRTLRIYVQQKDTSMAKFVEQLLEQHLEQQLKR